MLCSGEALSQISRRFPEEGIFFANMICNRNGSKTAAAVKVDKFWYGKLAVAEVGVCVQITKHHGLHHTDLSEFVRFLLVRGPFDLLMQCQECVCRKAIVPNQS